MVRGGAAATRRHCGAVDEARKNPFQNELKDHIAVVIADILCHILTKPFRGREGEGRFSCGKLHLGQNEPGGGREDVQFNGQIPQGDEAAFFRDGAAVGLGL